MCGDLCAVGVGVDEWGIDSAKSLSITRKGDLPRDADALFYPSSVTPVPRAI